MTPRDIEEPFERPRFGTDGLRGRAGRPPMDPETLRRVGAALGLYLQREGPEQKRVVLANDGRDSAGWILEALAQGLASTDCVAVDIGLGTTPALAYVTRAERFVAGIMISASHNPAEDNGVKVFQADGRKLATSAEREIEGLTTTIELGAVRTPRTPERAELLRRYQEHLATSFPAVDLDGATVVVDAANGGGSHLAPSVLRMFGADVVEVACEPDGQNINLGSGALHPDGLVDIVRQSGAVLGICLDGDGDRSIFVDDRGTVHDGDSVLATLAPRLRAMDALPGHTVVATVMSNLGLRRHLADQGIRLEMTPVGDRALAERMIAAGYALGAEQSGHVLFWRDGELCGDGLYTALMLLSLPGVTERGASAAFVTFPRYPQVLINVDVAHKPDLDSIPAVIEEQRRIEAELGDEGRVVLRYSGTEHLCRVMVEGPQQDVVEDRAARLARTVSAALGR